MIREKARRALICRSLMAVLCLAQAAHAQKYKMEDVPPPGATGKALPLDGRVTDLKGLSLSVAGPS